MGDRTPNERTKTRRDHEPPGGAAGEPRSGAAGEPRSVAAADSRAGALVGAAVLGTTSGVAIALSAASPHWLDASELAAASFELGNAHPPGHPLAILVGKAMTLLPLGPIAFRVSLGSALALGVAALLLCFAIHRSGRLTWAALGLERGALRPWVAWPVAAFGALGLALGPAALYQGVRPEVYALNLALTVGMVHLAMRLLEHGRARDLLLAALVAGLGAGNHHLLTLATVPAVVLAWSVGARASFGRRARQAALALVAGLVGLMVLAHLPARSTGAPEINWGAPHTLSRFGWTVSARLFVRTAERSVAKEQGARVGAMAKSASEELGGGILLLSLAGAVLLCLRRSSRWLLAVIVLAAGGSALGAFLGGFDPQNPDSQGYLLLCLAMLGLLGAVVLSVALSFLGGAQGARPVISRLAVVAAFGAVVWPVQGLAGALPRADLRRAEGAEVMAEALLDSAPNGALLLTSYYQTGFAIWAVRILGGARPDVDHVHRTFLGQPGYVENLLVRRPSLGPLFGGLRWPRDLGARRLGGELSRRAVLFEPDDDTVGPDLLRDSEPWGALRRLRAPGDLRARPSEPMRKIAESRWAELEARLGPHRVDPATRAWLLFAYYMDARANKARGDCASTAFGLARAREVGNPEDPFLRRLARDCALR